MISPLAIGLGLLLGAGILCLRGMRRSVRIVLALILAGGVGWGAPALVQAARIRAEAPVISNLYLIAVRQAALRAAVIIDRDEDGVGEYGGLNALRRTQPPLIHDNLAAGEEFGYRYYIILDRMPDQNELAFYAYAVPAWYGVTGRRSLYVDESQVVRIADAGPSGLITRDQGAAWPEAPLDFGS